MVFKPKVNSWRSEGPCMWWTSCGLKYRFPAFHHSLPTSIYILGLSSDPACWLLLPGGASAAQVAGGPWERALPSARAGQPLASSLGAGLTSREVFVLACKQLVCKLLLISPRHVVCGCSEVFGGHVYSHPAYPSSAGTSNIAPLDGFPVLYCTLKPSTGKPLPRSLAETALYRLAHVFLHKRFWSLHWEYKYNSKPCGFPPLPRKLPVCFTEGDGPSPTAFKVQLSYFSSPC